MGNNVTPHHRIVITVTLGIIYNNFTFTGTGMVQNTIHQFITAQRAKLQY